MRLAEEHGVPIHRSPDLMHFILDIFSALKKLAILSSLCVGQTSIEMNVSSIHMNELSCRMARSF